MTGNIEKTRAILQAAGGTAFPLSVVLTTDARTGAPTSQENWPGMTLRDYFAGQALAGMLAGVPGGHLIPTAEKLGKEAYEAADALIAARKVGAA